MAYITCKPEDAIKYRRVFQIPAYKVVCTTACYITTSNVMPHEVMCVVDQLRAEGWRVKEITSSYDYDF